MIPSIPARPGVIAFEDDQGRTQLLGTSADARAFCAGRLASDGNAGKANVGAITTRVWVYPVSSGFEADLQYLAAARERMPRVYRQHLARTALAFVRLDPRAPFPEPQVLEPEHSRGCDPATLLGPFPRAKAAPFADALIDAFDLCRYPSVLKLAPAGTPCAYKEMGRCPAPCDGSESLDSYRARTRSAIIEVGLPGTARATSLEARMKDVAQSGDFEAAGVLKKALDRVRALGPGACRFSTFRHMVVVPGQTRAAKPRLWGWVGGSAVAVWDHTKVTEGVRTLLETPVRVPESPAELEALGVLHSWTRETGRRRVRVLKILGSADAATVESAVRALSKSAPAPQGDADVVETESTGAM